MPYIMTGKVAGEEISSTYEGRHVEVQESDMVHPAHGDGLVDKGDPIIVGEGGIVGVAFESAASASGIIAVDTEGIWALSVVAVDDDGNSAVARGDRLYINTGTAILSKIDNVFFQRLFGVALSTLSSGATGIVAVKVHQDPAMPGEYHGAITGASNVTQVHVRDTGTPSSDYSRALYLNYAATGDKTGSAEINVLGADLVLTGANTPYAYITSLYLATATNPTISLASALSVYVDDLGTACANLHLLDLMFGSANAPTTRGCYARIRNHSNAATPTSVFYLQANNNAKAATNFIEQDRVTVGPVIDNTSNVPAACTHVVQCLHGTDTFYLIGTVLPT